jgi:hypothetical protein
MNKNQYGPKYIGMQELQIQQKRKNILNLSQSNITIYISLKISTKVN